MSAVVEGRPQPVGDTPARPPKLRPVVAWAAMGGLIWCFQGYILLRWLTGPYFTPVPYGPDEPPSWMKATIVGFGTLQVLFFLAVAWWTLARPWIRERRVTFDGLLFTSFCAWFWFWDPLANAFGLHFTYNAWIPNRGSWVNEIPGWLTPGEPGAQVPEPFLFSAPAYAGLFLLAVAGSVVIRRVMSTGRRGMFSALVIGYLATFLLITGLEVLWIRLGFYAFPGAYKPWTLFPEHFYAYPLYESLFAGPLTAAAYLRHAVDDRGLSVAERGLDKVRHGGPKNCLRLLAITAGGQVFTPPGVAPVDQPKTFDEAKRRYQAGER